MAPLPDELTTQTLNAATTIETPPTPVPAATPVPAPIPVPSPIPTPIPVPVPVATPPPIPAPAATITTTTLQATTKGWFLALRANVAPFGAAGTTQFKDGDTNLGDPEPVFDGGGLAELFAALNIPVPALSGFAISFTSLPPGTHTLTAIFSPTNPAAYQPSTSPPVTVTINPPS